MSPENLAVTRTPKVTITDKVSYAMGWLVSQTPNGSVTWHPGGTLGFGAYLGLLLDRDVGAIVLTNEAGTNFPDALGAWTLDRLLGNPAHDDTAAMLKTVEARFLDNTKTYAKPADPRPFPPLPPLAGSFTSPSFGKAVLRPQGDALMFKLLATGAELKLEPWNGDVFTIRLVPSGRFAAVVETFGDTPLGFAQFQMDRAGKLGELRLSFDAQNFEFNGQVFEFSRDAKKTTK